MSTHPPTVLPKCLGKLSTTFQEVRGLFHLLDFGVPIGMGDDELVALADLRSPNLIAEALTLAIEEPDHLVIHPVEHYCSMVSA
jgi:hypothetical protein